MCLSSDIETCRRLVEDEQFRHAGQGHRNDNPLQLAAGELVGIALGHSRRLRQVHQAQQLNHPVTRRRLTVVEVQHQRLCNLGAYPYGGRQRLTSVLRDKSHPLPAELLEFLRCQTEQVHPVKARRAGP